MKKSNITRVSAKTFDELLLESINEALSSLGESAKNAIYFYFEENFCVKKIGIPNRIEDFSVVLEKIFGLGARNLEILIMVRLHEKISCAYAWSGPGWLAPDLTFCHYVKLLRLSYEDKGKIGEVEVGVIAEEQKQLV